MSFTPENKNLLPFSVAHFSHTQHQCILFLETTFLLQVSSLQLTNLGVIWLGEGKH